MSKKVIRSMSVLILFLVYISPVTAGSPGDTQEDLWKNESFIKKAQAAKAGNWKRVKSRDVAIVTLFELGRAADRIERSLQSRMDRFYTFAYWGAAILGLYLVLQLAMSLIVIARLGRRTGQGGVRGTWPPEGDFQL